MAINVAVVGLGKMGLSHLSIINALEDFRVVAICDSSQLVSKVLGKVTGLPAYSSFDEVLAIEGLDAVVISTPTVLHEAMVRKALDRGCHVFCEKPLTLASAVSDELAAIASAKGLVTQVGYHNRFVGTFREAARLIAGGTLGRVAHVLGEAYGPVVLRPTKPTWRGKAGQGGGCLYDYAAHPINLLNWYFGQPHACAGSQLKRFFSSEVEDEVYAILDFDKGVSGQISVNWSDPSVRKMTTRISVWGEGGKLFVDRQEMQLFLSGNVAIPEGYTKGWNVRYITDLTAPVSFYVRGEEYSSQLEVFGRAIADPQAPRENDFASAASTDRTLEMIRSGASGTAMANPPTPVAAPRRLVRNLFGR